MLCFCFVFVVEFIFARCTLRVFSLRPLYRKKISHQSVDPLRLISTFAKDFIRKESQLFFAFSITFKVQE